MGLLGCTKYKLVFRSTAHLFEPQSLFSPDRGEKRMIRSVLFLELLIQTEHSSEIYHPSTFDNKLGRKYPNLLWGDAVI